jgi:hypothetical protein
MNQKSSSFFIRFTLAFTLITLCIVTFASRAATLPLADLAIYDDALAGGWQNWSWDGTYDPTHTTTVHNGSNAMAVTYTAAWAGFYHPHDGLAATPYESLRVWLHGGSRGGPAVSV